MSSVAIDDAAPRWAYLSASGLERAERCPWAYAMDQDPRELAENDVEVTDASRGTAIHAYLERVGDGMSRADALALCPAEVLDTCEGINLTILPPGINERSFAFDAATGKARALPKSKGHRGYIGLGPSEIPGTFDRLVRPEHNRGLWCVIDWKTGYESVPDVRDCLQLDLHLVGIADTYGVDEAEKAIVRIDAEGCTHWDCHVADRLEIDLARERIRRVWQGVEAARKDRMAGLSAQVREGTQCKWCPAKRSCPRYAQEAAALARMDGGWAAAVVAQLENDADAAAWVHRVKVAKDVIATIDTAIRARAATRPIPLGDGKVLALSPQVTRRVDGKRALPVIQDLLGAEIAGACADVSMSLKSIREACGQHAEEVIGLLDEAGAITRATIQVPRVVRESRPRKSLPTTKRGNR